MVVSVYVCLLALATGKDISRNETESQQSEEQNGKPDSDAQGAHGPVCAASVFDEKNQPREQADEDTQHDQQDQSVEHFVSSVLQFERTWNQGKSVMSRTAEIRLKVDLDGDQFPTRIEWLATDSGAEAAECQSMLLSLWDRDKQATAAIDLWTKDTTIDEMNLHFFQVFHKLGDTYLRATQNADVANLIHEFGNGFGQRLGLIEKQ